MATVVALTAWKKSEMALLVAMLVAIERERGLKSNCLAFLYIKEKVFATF